VAIIGDVTNISIKQFSRRKKKILNEEGEQIEIESIVADSPRNVLLATFPKNDIIEE